MTAATPGPTATSLGQDPVGFLHHLFEVAVRRAQPLHNLGGWLPQPPDPSQGRTLVLGAGKAAGAMAQALELLWPAHAGVGARLDGLVITRYGHTPPREGPLAHVPPRIEVVEAAHPVPDEAGLLATRRMLALTEGLTEHDLVLCLMSGGGSALLTLPCDRLTLADKQRINRELLHSGASIREMNCVRKHLSAVKGGRLAAACWPARVVTLAISDVPGDDLSVIASGPTVPDPSTCEQALAILKHYAIAVPPAVLAHLSQAEAETPKPGDPRLQHAGQPLAAHLIATPQQSLAAAAEAARAAGLNAYILSDEVEGESRDVAKVHAALARSTAADKSAFVRPCVLLSGGETTVTVSSATAVAGAGAVAGGASARGGRAGEFGLALALALQGQSGVWALVADTDGIDGTEDNAGVWVDPHTLARAQAQGLSPQAHLSAHDSYGFFQALNALVTTGPTHTNVNDFRVLLCL